MICSCGYVGDPFPPSLDIPATIADFRAWESGPNIEMEFTLPKLTTEGLTLKNLQSVELSVVESPAAVSAPSATHYQIPVPATDGSVTHAIPAAAWVGKTVIIGVRATGPKNKASAWSNPSVLAVIQPLAKPAALKVDNVAQGVALAWNGSGPHYRVFRAEGDGQPSLLTETDGQSYIDTTTNYGTRYRYLVQSIAEQNQWSEVSDAVEIAPVDTFAPAVPAGVTALASAQSIELSWSRNTEPDFRGYNVFRSTDGGPNVKINTELVETPAYSDTKVEAGKKYRYTVSAVDATGNESAQSAPPAEATL